jgi:DNA-binding NtrC family response regulator
VIAATHEDLAARIARGAFRQDLFARLAGHQVVLPPLRARRADLGQLVAGVLARIARDGVREAAAARMSRGAMRALFEHAWPMNVRELEHVLIRAVALAGPDEIEEAHLGLAEEPAPPEAAGPPEAAAGAPRDRDELMRLLAVHGGNVAAVARALETSPSHVRRLLQREAIDLEEVRQQLAPPKPWQGGP